MKVSGLYCLKNHQILLFEVQNHIK